jgi:ribosome maturation factor RimP
MGKLKQLAMHVEDTIHACVQDGWDECQGTIDEMKNVTRQNIDDQLERIAEEHGFELEDLQALFNDSETIEDIIDNALYDTWEV